MNEIINTISTEIYFINHMGWASTNLKECYIHTKYSTLYRDVEAKVFHKVFNLTYVSFTPMDIYINRENDAYYDAFYK